MTNDSKHTLQAKAYDATGNIGESSMTTVTVKNGPPQVTIVSPRDGETVQGTITIKAEAYDDKGISQVSFYLNNDFLERIVSTPYECTWDTRKVIDGTYKLMVTVNDLSGNYSFASVNIPVNNGQKKFGGSYYDCAYSIQQTTDGGYIVAMYMYTYWPGIAFGTGYSDAYALKLSSTGTLEWQKKFGGVGYSIQQTDDADTSLPDIQHHLDQKIKMLTWQN